MEFTTLIFGNGLGRAINTNYFDLKSAIRKIWRDEGSFGISKSDKASIRSCLIRQNGKAPNIPESEDQLIALMQTVNACRLLRERQPKRPKWLTKKFESFPESTNRFLSLVSAYFHNYNQEELPDLYHNFINHLSALIEKNNVHIATLNYDNLLYQPLIERNILRGYDGRLIDGFTNKGFSAANLERKKSSLGWYLHLHGSPLFYQDNSGTIRKLKQNSLEKSFTDQDHSHRHVVLCHVKDKVDLIASSDLLSSYWNFLRRGLSESSKVIIFGYGGGDTHLNRELSVWFNNRKRLGRPPHFEIVERTNKVSLKDRKKHWAGLISFEQTIDSEELKVSFEENILNYNWED